MPTALETTHVVMNRTLIVYQRERSTVWQCRYRVNRRWQRASTGEHELPKAIEKAHKMYIAAEVQYFAVVLDLFSRRIVGWSMSQEMTAQLVTDALVMEVWRRGKPRELLHHSDQESQYTSERFQTLLAEFGITCSMSRRGDVWDNSAMESFFSSLKTARTSRIQYRSRNQCRADLFDYVERFYNVRCRHSTIGQVSPAEFELLATKA